MAKFLASLEAERCSMRLALSKDGTDEAGGPLYHAWKGGYALFSVCSSNMICFVFYRAHSACSGEENGLGGKHVPWVPG